MSVTGRMLDEADGAAYRAEQECKRLRAALRDAARTLDECVPALSRAAQQGFALMAHLGADRAWKALNEPRSTG